MPLPRKKSCYQCRVAKARCNLESICSRCVDRGLRCDYSGTSVRPSPYSRPVSASRPMRPVLGRPEEAPKDTPPASESVDLELGSPWNSARPDRGDEGNHSSLSVDNQNSGNSSRVADESNPTDISDFLDWESPDWIGDESPDILSAPLPVSQSSISTSVAWDSTRPDWLTPPGSDKAFCLQHAFEDSSDRQTTVSQQNASAEIADLLTPYGGNSRVRVCRSFLPTDKRTYSCRKLLSQRVATETDTYLTTRVLIGQITNYPKRLTQSGKLPPFIYPRCVLEDRLTDHCVVNGMHQCLPHPLAHCASLVHMFYTQTPGGGQFAWDTIYAELRRLHKSYESFDEETLLAALQAMTIYILLQAQDIDSIEQNTVPWLLNIMADFGTQLHLCNSCIAEPLNLKRVNRRAWALNEAFRRTACLLQVMEALLDVYIGDQRTPDCIGFGPIPLPCSRDLWDWETTESWAARAQRYKHARQSERVLTLGDLYCRGGGQQAQRAGGEGDAAGLTRDLAAWCDRVDEFGTLVWMAASLDRQR